MSEFRDWLLVLFTGASGVFTGLIWWASRRAPNARYIMRVEAFTDGTKTKLGFSVEILNRSENEMTIEGISVAEPCSILVSDGALIAATSHQFANAEAAQRTQHANCSYVVPSGGTFTPSFILARAGGFDSCKAVSIRLHILRSFPIIRHKKKTLTAILPANIRNAKS